MTHISQSESEGNLLYVRLVSRIPPGKPEEWASSLIALSLSTFKVFLRRDYSLTLTPNQLSCRCFLKLCAYRDDVFQKLWFVLSSGATAKISFPCTCIMCIHTLLQSQAENQQVNPTPHLPSRYGEVWFFFLVILHDKGHADILVCLLLFTTTPSSSFYRAEVIFFHRQIHPLLGSYLCRRSTGVFWEHNAI